MRKENIYPLPLFYTYQWLLFGGKAQNQHLEVQHLQV